MSSDKRRVLIVDDSPDDIHVLMENLKGEYAVTAATSGEKAVAMAAKSPPPDVILMDVVMPEMDGYAACRRLKDDPGTSDIDVIFVSAHDTTDEKLTGYQAGGSDYLIKPVQPAELLQKIRLAIDAKDARASSAAETQSAISTAMTAITNAGEQGVVIDFMRRSFAADSLEDLARLLAESTAGFGLSNTVQIRTDRETINVGSNGPASPLEQELLMRLKDAVRLQESGARFIINYGGVSQLIKNMPDDADKRGRLRDHLAMMVEGADARLQTLQMDAELAQVVQESRAALQDIQAMQTAQKKKAMQIMDDVIENLQASFLSYGLHEDQEEVLLKVVQTGVDETLDNFEQGLKIDAHLQAIVDRLTAFRK